MNDDDVISRRQLLKKASPLGRIMLEKDKCTACGLCALECPTGALTVSFAEETDMFKILFKHGSCVACSQCVEICPEKCLRMERLLELDKINSQSVLFEGEIIGCSRCGAAIGPKVMIDKLKARVKSSGHSFISQFTLCPSCRLRTQSGWLSVSNGHST